MNPTKEQLADPKWWDSLDKKWAKYFGTHRRTGKPIFANDEWWQYAEGGRGYGFEDIRLAHYLKIKAVRPVTAKQWTGPQDGLPPVGTVCEVKGYEEGDFAEAIVIAYNDDQSMFWYCTDGINGIHETSKAEFRPIRTPEQLAAEERDKECRAMAEVLKSEQDSSEYYAAKALYDAGFGYRKQPTTPPEDMTDCRNWRTGDLVECVSHNHDWSEMYKIGSIKKIGEISENEQKGLNVFLGRYWVNPADFRWHSRPSA